MLGEEKIEGTWEIKINNRVIRFPKELNIEEEEILVIVNMGDYYEIISYEVFKEKVNSAEKLIQKKRAAGDKSYYRLKEELINYYKGVEVPIRVKSGKMQIPKKVNDRIHLEGDYELEGHDNMVRMRKK